MNEEQAIAPYSTLPPIKRPKILRKHPKWSDIHADVVTSSLTPRQICEKFGIKRDDGSMPIGIILRYRRDVFERFKDLFAAADQMEQRAERESVRGKFDHVYNCAVEGHEMAKNQKEIKGRGKTLTVIDAPDFTAMKEQQDSMLNAAAKMGEIVGIGGETTVQPPAFVDQRTQLFQILSLPKQPGVPTRAPLRIVEGKTA